jgi:hypothetical protein
MTTLKDFEEALRERGMTMALAVLDKLREKDRTRRSVAPPRRVRGDDARAGPSNRRTSSDE